MTLVLTNESKKIIQKYKEICSKIRDLIRSITKNADGYDEKFMKIKFNSDDELPLNKAIKIPSMIIVVRAVFPENNKHHPQVFLDECLYNYRRKRDNNIICEAKKFYILFAFLLIAIVLLIAAHIYCYLIKYKAKKKNLLPFDVTNNELKGILY